MFSVVFYSFLLVSCWTSTFADQLTVKPGDDVVLQSQAPTEAVIRLLEWIRPDLKSDGDVFFYRNDRSYEKYQHPSYRARVELKDPEMKNGDASVILKNVTVNDTGTYECRIISSITINERTSSELRYIVKLAVSDSGHAAGGDEDGEKKDVAVVLSVSVLLVVVVVVVVVSFLIFKKKHLKQTKYKPASERDGEHQDA
ncbi:butyrophilin-like protein 1 isoform X2 [Anabas testudineus]|uniref:butyrophilin-like protein 1 isoform X2 n=1 Tax=Anabas testudineus TaxID=64144 RepID=UPI000E456F6A|nr:butyrophilin-like protein 1 isoform X2 [Anabas testudineus]